MRARPSVYAPPLVLLIAIAACSGCSAERPRTHAEASRPSPTARVVTIEVGGMTCAACEQKIDTQLSRVPGVTAVDVSLERRDARVTCAPGVADTSLIAAVRRAGPEYLGLIVSR